MLDILNPIIMKLGDVVAFATLIKFAVFILVLSIIVFIHEYGHFIVGRWCGVGVEEFSIGFGREIFGWNDRHGTRWKVCWLPLGGYVRFMGDANAASMPDDEAVSSMTAEERSISLPAQPVWKRAAIIAAGPAANFLLAIVIDAGFYGINGKTILEPRIDEIVVGSRAEEAGLKPGDLILTMDGEVVSSFPDVAQYISLNPEKPIRIGIVRDNAEIVVTATPKLEKVSSPVGIVEAGQLGFKVNPQAPGRLQRKQFGPVDAVIEGCRETWAIIGQNLTGIGKILTGQISFKQMSGPIGIGQMTGYVADMGLLALIGFVAFLSVSIGMVNLLPIPVLDGGHLLFCLIEAISRRPLNEKVQDVAFRLGFALLLTLILVVSWNDIVRFFVS